MPIYFDNNEYEALIDTGASRSFIDRSIVDDARIKVINAQGNVYLGHKEMHVARIGSTEDIEIECNNHCLTSAFEVFDLQHSFVIGMDLFHKLGFSMGGISDGRESAKACLDQSTMNDLPFCL
ncbi:hypothetical protein BC939DRAFT_508950 [Gamsiella multidivaricata]|uniref:uncharacterized protein n=1 Tax=Gamsiella multidivaricata TaxID=101098 RepID=UPI0022209A40|nr:uncharacterized protein BC939DRAFT_508950 [Gamsiella multidivaricata]KAI7815789.1 hypothetical protein BC939DRAFT_508950 [Gamsiella multidivaricata]